MIEQGTTRFRFHAKEGQPPVLQQMWRVEIEQPAPVLTDEQKRQQTITIGSLSYVDFIWRDVPVVTEKDPRADQ